MSSSQATIRAAGEGESFRAGPFFIVTRVAGAQTQGAFEMYELELGPQGVVDYHVHHRMDETISVLEGEVQFQVAGKQYPAQPGATAFIPRGVPHGFANAGPGRARVLLVFSPQGGQNDYFRALEKLFAAPTLDVPVLHQLQQRYDQELIPAGTP